MLGVRRARWSRVDVSAWACSPAGREEVGTQVERPLEETWPLGRVNRRGPQCVSPGGHLQAVGQLERLVQSRRVQQRQQGAPRVLQGQVSSEDVFDEAEPLHLQSSQLGSRDLALLEAGAIEGDHAVDLVEGRLRDGSVGLGQHGGEVGDADITPDLAGPVLHDELRGGPARFGDVRAQPTPSRRFEFLVEPDGELLAPPVARAYRLERRVARGIDRQGRVGPPGRRQAVALGRIDAGARRHHRRVPLDGEGHGLLQRQPFRDGRLGRHDARAAEPRTGGPGRHREHADE